MRTDLTRDLSFSENGLSGMFLERFLDKVPLVFKVVSAGRCSAEGMLSGDCSIFSVFTVARTVGGVVSIPPAGEEGGSASISKVLRST